MTTLETRKFPESPQLYQIGLEAQRRARRYLEALGYVCVSENWRFKRGEADLLMTFGHDLVLVEVRSSRETRARGARYLYSSISFSKQRALHRTLTIFIQRHPQWKTWMRRIEMVWVFADGLEHWTQPF